MVFELKTLGPTCGEDRSIPALLELQQPCVTRVAMQLAWFHYFTASLQRHQANKLPGTPVLVLKSLGSSQSEARSLTYSPHQDCQKPQKSHSHLTAIAMYVKTAKLCSSQLFWEEMQTKPMKLIDTVIFGLKILGTLRKGPSQESFQFYRYWIS